MRTSVALVVAAALAGALAPAAASATPPSLIRLVSTTTSYSHVDVKPKGASAGDRDTFASRLVNERAQFGKPKGAVVGSDRGTLLYTSDRTATMKAVVKLPGGTVVLGGAVRPVGNNAVVVSVVGGTGVFSGARGTVTILEPTSSKTAVNVYRLTYAPVA
jgi:hypothetical protein